MKHLRSVVAILIGLAGCARPPASPVVVAIDPPAPAASAVAPAKVAEAEPVRLAGTVWAGPDSHGDHYEYHFIPSGELHYSSSSGFWKNGTWKQDGAKVYMETNNKYSERWGIISGRRMSGEAKNVTGAAWTWTADMRLEREHEVAR